MTDAERRLDPGEVLDAAETLEADRALLLELEPEAGRLLERHIKVAQEWFPHDFVPYRLGRDFDREPWTPDQPRLSGVAQTAFEIGLLTEDNLPSYHRLIHGMFGKGDGAWLNWVGRWTAEEGRHAIVLRDYLTVTRNIDPVLLERGRMTQLQQGYEHDAPTTLRGLAYVAFQELATRISHRNTGRFSTDPVADRIMARIAADENLHMVFYRDILDAALKLQPSAAVRAIVDEVLAFEMPGAAIPGSCARRPRSRKPGSTTCACTATRCSCRSSGIGGSSSWRASTRRPRTLGGGWPSTSSGSTRRLAASRSGSRRRAPRESLREADPPVRSIRSGAGPASGTPRRPPGRTATESR